MTRPPSHLSVAVTKEQLRRWRRAARTDPRFQALGDRALSAWVRAKLDQASASPQTATTEEVLT